MYNGESTLNCSVLLIIREMKRGKSIWKRNLGTRRDGGYIGSLRGCSPLEYIIKRD